MLFEADFIHDHYVDLSAVDYDAPLFWTRVYQMPVAGKHKEQ